MYKSNALFRNILLKSFYLLLLTSICSDLTGQTINEAFRYSQSFTGSTARLNAMAGSFGAMGGDLGVMAINPAGIAAFRESEFVFTPSYHRNSSMSQLAGGNQESNASGGVGLDNIGAVFSKRPIASNWLTSNFAIGINKIANFNEEFIISGNTEGSITDRFVELANGLTLNQLDNFEAGVAYDALAIFLEGPNSTNYFNDFFNDRVAVPKEQRVTRSGKLNDLSFAWAGNLKNKLSVGLSLGIPILEFAELKRYNETNQNDDYPFRELFFTETLTTTAAGLNFSAGVIYKPVKNFRLGASVKSPNWYFMSDDFDTQMSYSYTDLYGELITTESESPLNSFDYRLLTPWRYTLSAGTLFKKDKLRGLLNLDVDFLNYSSTSFNLTTSEFSTTGDQEFENELNDMIASNFTNAINIKLGGELGYNQFRIRAGYASYGSAFSSDEFDNTNLYSAGLGIKGRKAYVDLAYQVFSVTQEYRPYRLLDENLEQVATIDNTINNYTLTVGFNF